MSNPSRATRAPKGAWIHRFAIRLLTAAFSLLVFWFLGFLVDDLRSIRGPELTDLEKQHLDPALVAQRDTLSRQIDELTRLIENQTEQQRIVGDSSRNLQQTLNQLLDLQKLALEKSLPFSESEQRNFNESLNLFLSNQTRYQELSRTASELLARKQEHIRGREEAQRALERQREPARAQYERLHRQHRLKLAFLQLAILLPILAAAAAAVMRRRGSLHFPLFLGFGIATLLKVTEVVHEYFPSRYFKYILIGGLLLVVARLLVHFIRTIAFPAAPWVLKQYREAYERFLCPVCEYPIRTGPRRFLFWTRRTVNRSVSPGAASAAEEPYTCPCCGSVLFERCPSCQGVRHALLPHCSHCGAARESAAPPTEAAQPGGSVSSGSVS